MHALDGIKVLDLSRVLAGPWATQTLADLGADVWKIEAPGSGDDTRQWLPPEIGGESTYFLCCNRSKRSIAVDFRTKEGQQILRDLACQADVVVENFRLGGLERFGLDYASLSGLNPRLVYCSISGFGRTGPRADEAGYDFAIQAESGLMSITGEVDGAPMKVGVAIADVVTGMNAVQAILAALFVRERTGKGQFIDLALLDSAVAVLANVGSAALVTQKAPRRFGNAHATVAPYQVFSGADGDFALAVGNDRQFALLCNEVLSRPDLAADPRFTTNKGRVTNIEALAASLAAAFAPYKVAELVAMLRQAGIPVGNIRSVPEALNAAEVVAREMVVEVADALHGSIKLVGSPLKLSDTPVRPATAPPRLGEHTAEVLTEVLGCSEERIQSLKASGAIA